MPTQREIDAYKWHHNKYGDMNSEACLLSVCPIHYPEAWDRAKAREDSAVSWISKLLAEEE